MKNIVYISSICWNYSWHRQQEMVSFFADKGYRILFVQPCRKNKPFDHFTKQVSERIWITQSIGLPFERCFWSVNKINGWLSCRHINRVLQELHFHNYILWIDRVHGLDIQRMCSNRYVIYDLVDDLFAFGKMKNKMLLLGLENRVLKRANLLLSSSKTLMERKIQQSRRSGESIFIPNGVDTSRFSTINRKKSDDFTIGFIGTISKRALNYELINRIAEDRPNWHIEFVGPGLEDDKERLKKMGVSVFDMVSSDEIPLVLSRFDVGIIPYNTNQRDMDYVFPRKALEYLAAGLPVVSTDLTELRSLYPYIHTAKNDADFIREIEKTKEEQIDGQERKSFSLNYDWNILLNDLQEKISSVFHEV